LAGPVRRFSFISFLVTEAKESGRGGDPADGITKKKKKRRQSTTTTTTTDLVSWNG
jgi:hypothetical protein